MQNIFNKYISSISSKFSYQETTEMGYRTDFEILLKEIFKEINVTRFDHDAKAKQGNKPDFVVVKASVPLLYIETKDIGVSLDKVEKSEQMRRYFGYANLILTDYVEFRFYRNGIRYCEPIRIADYNLKTRTITPISKNYNYVAKTILDFTQTHKEPIKSGEHLAKIMGGKAQRIRDNIRQIFDLESGKDLELEKVYKTIKKLLVHDLTKGAFADMYAQTLVYGLFVARYHDDKPETFSRQEARDLIPNSNPLLRHFFDHIVGPDFDNRLEHIVNELCLVFQHADVNKLMKQYFKEDSYGKEHRGPDPVIHFYEDFLKEYDPVLRKKMGAYYTPLPVVNFIVRSVDYLLKKEFNLPAGLADTSKLENGAHRVQILDPAVGTGTFISAVINIIYSRLLDSGQKGRWPAYVHNDLLPRIHGFELMMAPYTIAHLKLAMAFRQTGFKYFNRRLGIYLTNSLETSIGQQELFTAFGLAESIAEESREAAVIKDKTPIMVVIGNPPYSGESSNASYSGNDVYKREPTGGKLQERNSKWLNDDYVKFIRFAEHMIEKTGEGIVAMITAHGYIDNPTFRGMRSHLMKTFEEIYVLDLHGNANKKELAPDGSPDKNVFNIRQGVAIFIGLKRNKGQNKSFAKIYRADILGTRETKFEYLNNHFLNSINWDVIQPLKPNYEWITCDKGTLDQYREGFSVADLFPVSSVGIVTSRDKFIIDIDMRLLENRIQNFLNCRTPQEAMVKFNLKENRKWRIAKALKHEFNKSNIVPISYRPFDIRYIYYHDDFIERSREEVMRHLLESQNICLVTARSNKNPEVDHFYVSKNITEAKLGESSTQSAMFPLYLYLKDASFTPNLKTEIVKKIEKNIGEFIPEDIFDYIYGILYSWEYRKKYRRFLKIDFPRIPYPKNLESFKKLVLLGSELRLLHLLESPKVCQFITTYPVEGSDTVDRPTYKDGKVFINKDQYFGNVPEVAWNFYIGGYQPAKKWLTDRKGRILTNSELEHYQKIIVALTETDRIMREIDKVLK